MIGAPFDFVKSICVNNLRAFGRLTNLARLTIGVQLINLLGDIVLIRFCNLGIYGAGFASSIAQIVFGVTSYVLVIKKTDINKFEKKPWIREMKNILSTGFPRGLRVGLNAMQSWVLSCVVLYSLDMSGMAAKAACTSCYNILSIIFLSYSEIMQPLASVLHGAEDKVGSRNLITYSLARGVSITLIAQLLIEIFPAVFLGMYGIKSPDASQIAVLRIFTAVYSTRASIIAMLWLPSA
jgi:Na+-driven multidrug efflux pump